MRAQVPCGPRPDCEILGASRGWNLFPPDSRVLEYTPGGVDDDDDDDVDVLSPLLVGLFRVRDRDMNGEGGSVVRPLFGSSTRQIV